MMPDLRATTLARLGNPGLHGSDCKASPSATCVTGLPEERSFKRMAAFFYPAALETMVSVNPIYRLVYFLNKYLYIMIYVI